MDGYGKLFLLLLAIALILVGTSGRGREAFAALMGKTVKAPATQTVPSSNPTNLSPKAGESDLNFGNIG